MVQVWDEYRKILPFRYLQSRNGTAIILSFYGDRDDVRILMQKVNHKTRAYFVNALGLRGFLEPGVHEILIEAEKSGELREVTKY